MDFTIQNIINNYVDTHIDEIVSRLRVHMKDPATLEMVPYDPIRHRGLLMLFVYEGVHKIVDVSPESLLESILIKEQEVMDRVNAASEAVENLTQLITDQEDSRAQAESLRRAAEEARAAAELIRAASEGERVRNENTRQSQEQARQDQESSRVEAEQSRSSWYDVFKETVENWFSSPTSGTGIKERWETFKSAADSWKSLAESKFDTFFGTNDDAGIQGLWKRFFLKSQSDFQGLTDEMNSQEQQRQDAEARRVSAESARSGNETSRQNAEGQRSDAETQRQNQELSRQNQESSRQTNETDRQHEETMRSTSEQNREDAEDDRQAAEIQRQSDYRELMTNMQELFRQLAVRADHPAIYGTDGYIYEYDLTINEYVKTEHFWQKLDRFKISKEFASIAQMKVYDPESLPEGEDRLEKFSFVLIKSTVEDPDNSKLFSYNGDDAELDPDFGRFHYLGDFSGAMGFSGKTPQFSIGTIISGNPGTMPEVSLSSDGYDDNGNPKFKLNFSIPKGDPGIGIQSIEQTKQSAESEGENIWEVVLTDGTVKKFVVLNGQRGHQGKALSFDDLTGAQKMELAGLARDYRHDNETKTTVVVSGSVTPMAMVIKAPEFISLKNKERQYIKPHLYPSTVPQNVIYQKVSGTSAEVTPSGEIFALADGETIFWVIPTQNTSLWRQVSINVRGPRLRLASSGRMRLCNSGRMRIV